MKRVILIALLGAMSMGASAEQTVALDYAHGKIADGSKLNGVNAKYQRDLANNWGIIGSASYLTSGTDTMDYMIPPDKFEARAKSKYFSFGVGPSYRVHDKVRVYGLLGVARTKVSGDVTWYNHQSGSYINMGTSSGSYKKTAMSYGVGAQFMPTEQWGVDLAYEGAQSTNGLDNKRFSSVHIGLGYRF